jgi:hypothetical protein
MFFTDSILPLDQVSISEVVVMKYTLRASCVAVFVVGLLALSQAQDSINLQTNTEPAQPYVVTYVQYENSPQGNVKVTGRQTRYVKANGEWRLELYGPKGKDPLSKDSRETPVYAGGPDEVSAKGAGSTFRRYVSPPANQQMIDLFRSHNYLRHDREFVRTDVVAGLVVYVLRAVVTDSADAQEWIEQSYSPKTGYIPLRTVIHMRNGTEVRVEAESVEFKEVLEDLNDDMRALPMREKENKSPEKKDNLQ